ncbi:M24 family metallopeptidase [Pseudarthrobacter raffinosi]|uniref:M24 family metallopeptidase n=1 Tax=Pseudarthrobacter raffinosi TaxID=2953651 RepID=UPI00208F35EB|nr:MULTISPECIES: Xaa-Pro peptidase family protein [unclassified Pseudarthrobacter]MCO4237020.1 Xaa-Pro peptidase family protein [Pseudarthrobacter sp. MDT3-28]MCO4250750.1 Xaa-Pro peptidase family protein [Pseudarthrobacter sp. MDT3-9]MCO4261628.1 Xaa-Pro peptidase family protein [Pseudarthrobacter sp. MDT3-26]
MAVSVPFDEQYLEDLMEGAGIDALLATTKHNVQHLLGGYRFFFFAHADATGVSRYLPAVGIVRGKLDDSFYIGAGNEDWGTAGGAIWVSDIQNISWTSIDTARAAAAALEKRGLARATIGVEKSFIPADALDTLRELLPAATFVEVHPVLESLRGVKSERELELVRIASHGIIDSMQASFGLVQPGMTKHDIAEIFRLEQTRRGLFYEYALVTLGGGSMNRSPSSDVWRSGTSLSIDSGGMYEGYIGDLSRMAIDTEPTARQTDLLAQIETVQQEARTAVAAGKRGGDIFVTALDTISKLPDGANMKFVAHGMGLITHEVPRLTSTGPVPYFGAHANDPLKSGMVLSIESWFEDHESGFIKLEDTLIVTDDGWEAPGDSARGWNRTGAGL